MYRTARNAHTATGNVSSGPSGPAGPGGPADGAHGSSGPGSSGGDGWPPNPANPIVGVVIETARYLPGNSLPPSATPAICAALGIPTASVGGDVMVTKVAAGPAWFPNVEADLIEEYEYEVRLYEVVLGMDADVELGGVPIAVAAQLAATYTNATVVYQDGEWATVAISGFPLEVTAEVRHEFESAELGEYSVTVRDE